MTEINPWTRTARTILQRRAEDRDRNQLWKLCPRTICDDGSVFDTVNGVRQPPRYQCSVCSGVGWVVVTVEEEYMARAIQGK